MPPTCVGSSVDDKLGSKTADDISTIAETYNRCRLKSGVEEFIRHETHEKSVVQSRYKHMIFL
jgi:hypothetical protein